MEKEVLLTKADLESIRLKMTEAFASRLDSFERNLIAKINKIVLEKVSLSNVGKTISEEITIKVKVEKHYKMNDFLQECSNIVEKIASNSEIISKIEASISKNYHYRNEWIGTGIGLLVKEDLIEKLTIEDIGINIKVDLSL